MLSQMEDVSGQRWNRMPRVVSLAILAVKFKQEFFKKNQPLHFKMYQIPKAERFPMPKGG